jgi:peptidoglycan/LPS O-acetylase OafA/YrhL
MHYATAMRGRWIVAIGAIVIVGSSLLPWWQIGGGVGELSTQSGVGISDGRTFLMFLVAVACLLLVTVPFASEKPIPIDHPVVYLGLLALAIFAYVWRVILLAQLLLVPWPPQRGVGFWLAAVGLILLARGVFEVFEERRQRLY